MQTRTFDSDEHVYYISNTRKDLCEGLREGLQKSKHVKTPMTKNQQKARKAAKTAKKSRRRNR